MKFNDINAMLVVQFFVVYLSLGMEETWVHCHHIGECYDVFVLNSVVHFGHEVTTLRISSTLTTGLIMNHEGDKTVAHILTTSTLPSPEEGSS